MSAPIALSVFLSHVDHLTGTNGDGLVELAQLVEQAGADQIVLSEHVVLASEIEAAAVDAPLNAGLETAVQVNHISSHFEPLKIDTSLPTGPASLLSDAEKADLVEYLKSL